LIQSYRRLIPQKKNWLKEKNLYKIREEKKIF